MLYKEVMKKKSRSFFTKIQVNDQIERGKENEDFSLGVKFRCSVLIAPVKNESCDIILFILEFTESSDRNRQRKIRTYLCLSFFFSRVKLKKQTSRDLD